MLTTYSPAEVATIIDKNVSSVRRLADEFPDHLTGDAAPGKGKPRRFRPEDVALLVWIVDQTNTGRTLAEAREDLEAGVAELPDPALYERQQPEQESTALVDSATAQAFAAIAATIEGMRQETKERASVEERIAALEQRIEELEASIRATQDQATATQERLNAYDNASAWQRLRGPKR